MAIEIFDKSHQAKGSFNNGEILENKPIGFPQDGGFIKPYSNLFYWAHAWTSEKKSTIGLHPHKGFEICSFVLKGSINHFDTNQNQWIPLKQGDVQVIRSGSGISHSEELEKNSEIFQIWFDPNLSNSLNENATYDDYKKESFKISKSKNSKVKRILGEGSPMELKSEGISINEYEFEPGNNQIHIKNNFIHSFYLVSGNIETNQVIFQESFIKVYDTNTFDFSNHEKVKIFEIISPMETTYKTYAELNY